MSYDERGWIVALTDGTERRVYGYASTRDGILTITYRYHATIYFPLTSVLWWKPEDDRE